MENEVINIPAETLHAELAAMAVEQVKLAAMAFSLAAAITQQQRKLVVVHRALAEAKQ